MWSGAQMLASSCLAGLDVIDAVSLMMSAGLPTFVLGDPLRRRCYRRFRGEVLITHGSRVAAAEGASTGCRMRQSGIRVQGCRVYAVYGRCRGRFATVGEIRWQTVLPGPDPSQDGAQAGARVSGTPAALAVRSRDRRDRTGRVPVAIKIALDRSGECCESPTAKEIYQLAGRRPQCGGSLAFRWRNAAFWGRIAVQSRHRGAAAQLVPAVLPRPGLGAPGGAR